jgi:ribosomal protein L11 methyltransferase
VPYRIDVPDPSEHALERLIDLGALDVERIGDGLAAIMPDATSAIDVAAVLGVANLRVSTAIGLDDESVWMLARRPVRARSLLIVPAGHPAPPGALRLVDGPAFGTGLHATTALCLEAIEDLLDVSSHARILDIGTGSGVLALAALRGGVQRAVGLDIDADALRVAAENARVNSLGDRLMLVHGGPDAVRGAWPLVVANIRAAELMAMAPAIVRRIASRGSLVLSGIPGSVANEVEDAYRRFGMMRVNLSERAGWIALGLRPSW